ncbi:MAG: hypothetical protein ONB46_03220 [candidate division KSB1 bacterium]|nr:hypothetical protein [candidate division KSB1 bacterium]MDZ7365066.1 hypothetical protein [candidate division KSB1 bacterium]MDZ7403460.1 hypothetical protein [candidate division KSB1 bacterium]
MRKNNIHLLLAMAMSLGGAAQAQTPAEAPPAPRANTGAALSQWLDRTPATSHSANFPAAAEDCAMIYDPVDHRLVLFGGKNDANENVNEVWALDLRQNLWQQIAVTGETPPPSEDHAVIYDPAGHRMILHGGEDGLTTNKTWAFDLQTSRWRNMTDSTAPAREDHTAIYDSREKRMVIFGGRNNDGEIDHVNIEELWALDLDPASPRFEKWHRLPAGEKRPLGRSDHVAVFDARENRMIIYGGWDKDAKAYLGDTWAYYFPTFIDTVGHWRQLKTKKSYPPKRRHAVGAYDAGRNWFIICGGYGEEGYLNDVWAFDLTDDVWINVTPGPQPRLDHQAVYDPQSQRLIIWGGDARLKNKFHDLWELQINPGVSVEALRPTTEIRTSENQE